MDNRRTKDPFERTAFAVFLNIVLVLIYLVISNSVNLEKRPILIPSVLGLGVSLMLFWVFTLSRNLTWKMRILFVEILVWCMVVTANHEIYVRNKWQIIYPFVGLKSLAIVIALLGPPIRLPLIVSFVLFALLPVIQVHMGWSVEDRALIGVEEPWMTVAFVGVSAIIWYYRRRSRQQADQMEQYDVFKRFVHLLLGAQHLTNSPLQTIAANARLIAQDFPEAETRVLAIERAFEIVKRVGSLIAFGNQKIAWESEDVPDNLDELTKVVHELSAKFDDRLGRV